MAAVLLCSLLMVAATTVLHYEVLQGLHRRLPGLGLPMRSKLLVVMAVLLMAHVAEIVLYGLALRGLVSLGGSGQLGGDEASLAACLYFSAETFTSLGFGDLTPTGPLRLLAGVEALNGLLLIGWSASYGVLAMERFWRDADGPRP